MLLHPIVFSSVEFLSPCAIITLFANPITTTFDPVISTYFSHYHSEPSCAKTHNLFLKVLANKMDLAEHSSNGESN